MTTAGGVTNWYECSKGNERFDTPSRVSAASGMVSVTVSVDAPVYYHVWVFVRDSGTGEARVDPTLAPRFWDLADWWHSDTDGMSLDRESFTHTAYQRIVEELGKAAIPYILQDLQARHGHWYDALRILSGDDSVDAGANGSMRRARNAWLSWGKAKKYI